MKKIKLKFWGYTWEDYFYIIANKSGILICYKGYLDSEGDVKMKEIILVEEADKFSDIIESENFMNVTRETNKTDRLFFSFAEINGDERRQAKKILKNMLITKSDDTEYDNETVVTCTGACALFSKQLLQE